MWRTVIPIVALVGCNPPPPRWRVSGGFLRAPDGRAAILRGVNVSDAQKAPPYLDDKSASDYQRIRSDWGMNAIRFVMTWAAVEPVRGQYDDAYLAAVAERLDWADAAGLSVVLDMHQDVYGEGFGFDGAPRWTCDEARYAAFVPRTPWFLSVLDPNVAACVDQFWASQDLQSRFSAAWRHVAERLATKPAIVGFDVLNEPLFGSYSLFDFEHDRLQPAYERVVVAVREVAPWVAFLEPAASRNAGIPTGLAPFRFADVVYAPHLYDSTAEGGGAFDPSRRQPLLDNAAKLADEARALGAALWIGEYGAMPSIAGVADYLDADYAGAGAAAAGSMYWEYGKNGGYGLLDSDGSEKPALVDAVLRPFPERVAGDPIGWSWDSATSTFQFAYHADRSSALPTVISVPDRRYPDGYQVDCGGCVYEKAAGRLTIHTPAAADPTRITLGP